MSTLKEHYNSTYSTVLHLLLSFLVILCTSITIASCSATNEKKSKKLDDKYVFKGIPVRPSERKDALKEEKTIKFISDLSLAKNSLGQGNIDEAAELLVAYDDDFDFLPQSRQMEWWRVRSDLAYEQYNIEMVIKSEQQLHPLLTTNARHKRFDVIFSRLTTLDRITLQRLAHSMKDSVYASNWLSLTLLATGMPATRRHQIIAINRWKKKHKDNPVSRNLPEIIRRFLATTESPKNIALLLPASGSLAVFGKAIEEGFISIEKGLGIRTKVYDVHNSASLEQAMDDMARDGVDAVVGPIDKQLVSQIWNSNRFPMLLALNYVPSLTQRDGYVQFGLGIEDEAKFLAQISLYSGKQTVLAIHEQSTNGDRAYNAFKDYMPFDFYQPLRFANTKELARGISEAVNVSPSNIKEYRNALKQYENDPDSFEASPTDEMLQRNTVDAVVVFADPVNASQIKPLLDFYYAFDTPVLTTSNAYQLDQIDNFGREYEGVFIADVPVLGKKYTDWHPLIGGSEIDNFNVNLTRFYALGVDAAIAIANIQRLINVPEMKIAGTSGSLGFNSNNMTIARSPDLYFVQNGVLIQASYYPVQCDEEQRLCL